MKLLKQPATMSSGVGRVVSPEVIAVGSEDRLGYDPDSLAANGNIDLSGNPDGTQTVVSSSQGDEQGPYLLGDEVHRLSCLEVPKSIQSEVIASVPGGSQSPLISKSDLRDVNTLGGAPSAARSGSRAVGTVRNNDVGETTDQAVRGAAKFSNIHLHDKSSGPVKMQPTQTPLIPGGVGVGASAGRYGGSGGAVNEELLTRTYKDRLSDIAR